MNLFRAIFSLLDMVDFILNIRSVMAWELDELRFFFFFLGSTTPLNAPFRGAPAPNDFEFNLPSQLFIGYH